MVRAEVNHLEFFEYAPLGEAQVFCAAAKGGGVMLRWFPGDSRSAGSIEVVFGCAREVRP